MNLFEAAQEIANRLIRIFLRGPNGRRPVYGGREKFQADPHWRDYILFHEYFHGDNGAGIGASHQAGWPWGDAHRALQKPRRRETPRCKQKGSLYPGWDRIHIAKTEDHKMKEVMK